MKRIWKRAVCVFLSMIMIMGGLYPETWADKLNSFHIDLGALFPQKMSAQAALLNEVHTFTTLTEFVEYSKEC